MRHIWHPLGSKCEKRAPSGSQTVRHDTAGRPDRFPIGMNALVADQNYRLVLNLMHSLSGLLR
jgi:hypothetical protein